jgi:replicative DNA helicase
MKQEKRMYVRLTRGLADVGTLIPKNENPFNYIKNFDEDYYLSLYEYTEEQKNQAEEVILITDEAKGSSYKRQRGVSGINNVVTDCLAFDFDSKDLEVARKDTVVLVDRLIDYGIDKNSIKVSFSGNKGFSVVVNHDTELSPEKHKQIAKALAGDLETFDTKIYNASRIFRLDYTRHGETHLYKTPLNISNLKSLTIDSIKKQAKNKKDPYYEKTLTKLPEKLLAIKEQEVPKSLVELDIKEEIDFSSRPNFLTQAKFVLHKGFIPEGYGNTAFMILAATYKKAGFDRNDAFNMLWSVNEKRAAIYGEAKKRSEDEIMTQVINVVYSDSWQGGTYSEKDNELLASINEKYQVKAEKSDSKLVSLNDVTGIFKDFAENIDKNTIKIGIKTIDDNVRMTTSMLVELLAAPSAGKSSITFGILESLSSMNIDSMFLSLDMGAPLVYQRLVQRALGFSGDKIFAAFRNKDTGRILQIQRSVSDKYKNVSFCFRSGITVSDIRLMLEEERKNGRNIKFLAIDYLECLQGPYSDSTANKGFLAQQLKDIANDFELCLFLLVQPQKHAGDPSDELNSYRLVKGSSVLEEQASIILSMHRPGFDPQHVDDDNFLNITVLKNRMGQLGSYDFNWDGLRGSITEMSPEDRATLKTLREQVSLRKKAKEEKPF